MSIFVPRIQIQGTEVFYVFGNKKTEVPKSLHEEKSSRIVTSNTSHGYASVNDSISQCNSNVNIEKPAEQKNDNENKKSLKPFGFKLFGTPSRFKSEHFRVS